MIKKIFAFIAINIIAISSSNASNMLEKLPNIVENTFIAKKIINEKSDDKILKQIGNIDKLHPPFSTFKIALSLMGFDYGILKSKNEPTWSFKDEYKKNNDIYDNPVYASTVAKWIMNHNPQTFMRDSVIWYSHEITRQLGMETFKKYVSDLQYGNKDVSGTPGKNDGLLNAWLGTSLEISPLEQLKLLEKLLTKSLPLSKEAQEKTIEILDRHETWDGWKVYGKTGGGYGTQGWFIGWIEKDDCQIAFVQYLEFKSRIDQSVDGKSIGLICKDLVNVVLEEFIKS